jgi:hypothetical protein
VAILITSGKLFIAINKSSFDENLLFIRNSKSEVQVTVDDRLTTGVFTIDSSTPTLAKIIYPPNKVNKIVM